MALGGYFSRLKEGLSRSTQKLTEGITTVFQKRRLDATFSLIQEYRSPGPNPSGLYWDGKYLWSLDSSLHKFFQQDPATLALLASYPSPGKAPVGLLKVGDLLVTPPVNFL